MMENLDWDRAHTIEEEEEDSPEGVLEEHRAREASNISKSDFNPYEEQNQTQDHDTTIKKPGKQMSAPAQQILHQSANLKKKKLKEPTRKPSQTFDS